MTGLVMKFRYKNKVNVFLELDTLEQNNNYYLFIAMNRACFMMHCE